MHTRNIKKELKAAGVMVLFVLVFAAAIVLPLVFVDGSASAGGDDRTKVFEHVFNVNVEPVSMIFRVADGHPWDMRPGERAVIEFLIQNHSPSRDWDVQVEFVVSTYEGEFYDSTSTGLMYAIWDNGVPYGREDVVVLAAGSKRVLSVVLTALDVAGQFKIKAVLYRLPKAGPVPSPVTPSHQNSH